MKVIAGLGNPGREYAQTKHNVGFWVIDKIAEDYNITINKIKHKAFVGEGSIFENKVMLVKPQTYMNLSGESIGEILRFYKLPISELIVIFDDISLPPGATRIRERGSAGGHNGIKSIINHLGTDEFLRVKVGIGEKPNGWDLADYVTSVFSKDDLAEVQSGVCKAKRAVELILTEGIQSAMNQTNQKMR